MRYLSSLAIVAAMILVACSEAPDGADNPASDAPPAVTDPNDVATNALPTSAGGDAAAAGVVTGLFQSFDRNENGSISRPEALSQMVFMLISQDTDADGRISREEFHRWDVGFESVARARGRIDAFAASKDDLFGRWDVDDDDYLTIQEFTTSIGNAFAEVDQEPQGQLDQEEFGSIDFLRGFQSAAE